MAPGPAISPLAWRLLRHLGLHVARSKQALALLCRALHHQLTFYCSAPGAVPYSRAGSAQEAEAARTQLVDLVASVVLPAVSLAGVEPALSGEVGAAQLSRAVLICACIALCCVVEGGGVHADMCCCARWGFLCIR